MRKKVLPMSSMNPMLERVRRKPGHEVDLLVVYLEWFIGL